MTGIKVYFSPLETQFIASSYHSLYLQDSCRKHLNQGEADRANIYSEGDF